MPNFLNISLFVFAFALVFAAPEADWDDKTEPGNAMTEKTIFYDLAGNIVPIKIQRYGEKNNLVFISLHDDEITAVDATKRILREHGGMLIELENNAQRNIRFKLGKHVYKVDPNTIFSKEGIKKSLEQFERTSVKAVNEVEKLGRRIIQLIPGNARCIVALHNNTPDFYSVSEYAPGNKRSVDCKKIYINDEQDADDFFLTTDNNLYENLAGKRYNVILQDNKNCTNDGSLSVYCGKKNIRYINCETEHGKSAQYYEMMKALVAFFENN
ncbi:MAG TPA: hypothetical protein VF144_05035 [Chitinophagaceae bacterium]